jgi:hypothetical protein
MRIALSVKFDVGRYSLELGIVPLPVWLPPWHARVFGEGLDFKRGFSAALGPFAILVKWPVV